MGDDHRSPEIESQGQGAVRMVTRCVLFSMLDRWHFSNSIGNSSWFLVLRPILTDRRRIA